jgi:hypothetical protein
LIEVGISEHAALTFCAMSGRDIVQRAGCDVLSQRFDRTAELVSRFARGAQTIRRCGALRLGLREHRKDAAFFLGESQRSKPGGFIFGLARVSLAFLAKLGKVFLDIAGNVLRPRERSGRKEHEALREGCTFGLRFERGCDRIHFAVSISKSIQAIRHFGARCFQHRALSI